MGIQKIGNCIWVWMKNQLNCIIAFFFFKTGMIWKHSSFVLAPRLKLLSHSEFSCKYSEDAENMKLVKDGVGFLIKMGHNICVCPLQTLSGLARAAFHFFQ